MGRGKRVPGARKLILVFVVITDLYTQAANNYHEGRSSMVFFLRRLLSRPENWLPEEHARVQVWDNVLSKSHICSL